MQEIGERIRALREAKGWTQAQLAEAMNLKRATGRASVSAMELGTATVGERRREALAKALGCTTAELTGEVAK